MSETKIDGRAIDYSMLPEHMRDRMKLYIEQHVPPGGFLRAVLENDLMGASAKADDINRNHLFDFCRFLYNEAPPNCFGSPDAVASWLENK